jgi:hypothetical protein
MKITIDEKICTKHKMTVQEVLIALAIRMGNFEDNYQNLYSREIAVPQNGISITQHWSDVLDEIISDSSGKIEKSDEELLELAKQMREFYPQGKMKDRFGRMTPYYYRCNNSEVVKKLKKFFTIFGNVPDEDILDATKRYVASFRGNYQYLKLLKYFVFKNEDEKDENGEVHKVKHSYLADFLEDGSTTESGTSDWNTQTL